MYWYDRALYPSLFHCVSSPNTRSTCLSGNCRWVPGGMTASQDSDGHRNIHSGVWVLSRISFIEDIDSAVSFMRNHHSQLHIAGITQIRSCCSDWHSGHQKFIILFLIKKKKKVGSLICWQYCIQK